MALTPEQKSEANRRGLARKAEREAREFSQKPQGGADYDRFRRVGLSHEEALAAIEKRKTAERRYVEERGDISPLGSGGSAEIVYMGPRGGRYRINESGRKSYDVP